MKRWLLKLSKSFIPDNNYGYQVDISDPKIKPLFERYMKWKGIPPWCPLSDKERLEFESYVLGEKKNEI